jgi:hypothetical protein
MKVWPRTIGIFVFWIIVSSVAYMIFTTGTAYNAATALFKQFLALSTSGLLLIYLLLKTVGHMIESEARTDVTATSESDVEATE